MPGSSNRLNGKATAMTDFENDGWVPPPSLCPARGPSGLGAFGTRGLAVTVPRMTTEDLVPQTEWPRRQSPHAWLP